MSSLKLHPDFVHSLKDRQARSTACQQLFHLASTKMMAELSPELSANFGCSELTLRRLFENEVRTLSTVCRCRCQDWSKVKLLLPAEKQGDDQSSMLLRKMSDTNLEGVVVLIGTPSATSSKEEAAKDDDTAKANLKQRLPVGIHSNAVISSSMVHLTARVHRNACVANTYIGDNAVVVHNGSLSFTKLTTRLALTVGPESGGGRTLHVTPEDRLPQVVEQMTKAASSSNHQPTGEADIQPTMNIFDTDTLVRDTPTLDSVYLHPNSQIVAASSVQRAVLLSHAQITGASHAKDVLLQWKASITDGSSVTETLLIEESHAGPNSCVVSTVLGPDVHVSCGEIHASVLGPNTNAHHQSLVIGVLWPAGRGNVGYGANVGSNHTGRLPDQECAAGEGIFWGLSAVIKFPLNLSESPYSIVAAGTTLPPQKISWPFALIVSGANQTNDILPGWLLKSSPYTLARSEKKFATRRKASRHADYTGWKIVRASTVWQCFQARQTLCDIAADGTSNQEWVGDRALAGLGACRLTERARAAGVVAYTQCIQLYALQGLLEHCQQDQEAAILDEIQTATAQPELAPVSDNGWTLFPWQDEKNDWSIQKFLLQTEFGASLLSEDRWLESCLNKLVELEQDYADRIHKSKSRDDHRGAQTVPGYSESHVPAHEDPVIVEARAQVQKVQAAVKAVLEKASL